jgi:NitT/TauT family transport system permease protein
MPTDMLEVAAPSIAPAVASAPALPSSSAHVGRPATKSGATSGVIAVPLAAGAALLAHYFIPDRELSPETGLYPRLLAVLLGVSLVAAAVQGFWPALRRWLRHNAPLVAAATLLVVAWELITVKLAWMPLPYFPGPEGVLQSLVTDRGLIFESTWRSLVLLLSGYAVGTALGLVTGITIGWSSRARYWGMPLLKTIGPIPATAWIPLAMVVSPSALVSAVGLIALAVWFPVTMLSASGVSNVRASYLDVARTLGAGRGYLIFRVAIPAALPSIFIGLFMGLGSSFLTLVVAESLGVKAGLGWYIDWARNYAEYSKVYAALVIMAVFFSTIMTVLFKLRDRVLVWQKGVIKW